MKKKCISAIMMLVLLFSMTPVYGNDGGETLPEGLYSLEEDGLYQKFTNYVDGYALNVDKGMNADMSMSEVYTVLEHNEKRIEIYKQSLGNGISREAYINYSNKFLENTIDHKNIIQRSQSLNGKAVSITEWTRDKLARVKNDKNYYACIEITGNSNTVYTIFVKSTMPITVSGGYQYLIKSFGTFTPTKAPYMRQAKLIDPETRGWNPETLQAYYEYFGENSSLKWGIFEPKAPQDFNELNHLEKAMDYEFTFLLTYTDFQKDIHPNLKYRLENAKSKNRILELTLQTPGIQDGNMVYDVLNGEYDVFLKDYASVIAESAYPVLFRLGNEMNGDWCPYSSYNTSKDTMIFKEFYKYVYRIFEEAGADNAIWVWNPNGKSFPDFKWNDANMYYPGDEYVDIIGLTEYNTGTYYEGETWTEFDQMYDSLYAEYMRLYDKPMMITEFASSSVGGDKANWIKNMFNHIGKYKNIKVAIWWDGCDWDANGNIARPYFIDESPNLLDIFREYLNKKHWSWDIYAYVNDSRDLITIGNTARYYYPSNTDEYLHLFKATYNEEILV